MEAESGEPTARGVWSGSLSFGLVSVPVELYSAQRPSALALRMLSPEGHALERRYVCPRENRPLERDEIVRGYEVAEGKFVAIEDAELRALAPRRSREIAITRFVPREAIDPAFFERAYFLLPSGEQARAYSLLADALESSGRAALAHFVMRDKAHAVVVLADSGILRAETLRFADELRSAREAGLGAPARAEARRVRTMTEAIEARARAELDLDELRDAREERLLGLARAKLAREQDVVEVAADSSAPAAEPEEGGGEVIDLVALLKRQLAQGRPGRKPARRAQRKRKTRAARE